MDSVLPTEVIQELRSKLSDKASILLRNDSTFTEQTKRWTSYECPTFAAAVIPAEERDIQIAMLCAKLHGIPFLASTGRHGAFSTMAALQNGLLIDLRHFDKVELSEDGSCATIGAGVLNMKIARDLWAAKKITVNGLCDTVGLGLWLGGGHGVLQGQLGLAIDQIIEARVILGDGRIVTVSETSEPDLFWGLRGAGFNFGIVTEMKLRVYDYEPFKTWTRETYIFSGDQVANVFNALNNMKSRQDRTAQYFGLFRYLPEIDPVKPILIVMVFAAKNDISPPLKDYSRPLHDIPHLNLTEGETSYLDIPKLFGSDEHGEACRKGPTFLRYGIDLIDYNIPAVLQSYDIFAQAMKDTPAFATGGSSMIFESYPVHAVREVPSETTAFPWRADDLLISPFITYAPDPSLDDKARELGSMLKGILHKGSGRKEVHSYINYANGSEDIETLYGYEEWRLRKLRELKGRYDPDNLFRFYGAIR